VLKSLELICRDNILKKRERKRSDRNQFRRVGEHLIAVNK
jgi:hypothetical protein